MWITNSYNWIKYLCWIAGVYCITSHYTQWQMLASGCKIRNVWHGYSGNFGEHWAKILKQPPSIQNCENFGCFLVAKRWGSTNT